MLRVKGRLDTVLTMTFRPVGRGELAQLLGVSRMRAYQLSKLADFPAPVAQLSNGNVWNLNDLIAWFDARAHERNLDLSVVDGIDEMSSSPGQLVSRRELELLIDRSRAQVGRLLESATFPPPVADLASGRIWSLSAVESWAAATGRELNFAALHQEQQP